MIDITHRHHKYNPERITRAQAHIDSVVTPVHDYSLETEEEWEARMNEIRLNNK